MTEDTCASGIGTDCGECLEDAEIPVDIGDYREDKAGYCLERCERDVIEKTHFAFTFCS
jgi:hypothetical protein